MPELEEAWVHKACCLRLTVDYLCFGESGGAGRCEDFFRPMIHQAALHYLIACYTAQLSSTHSRLISGNNTSEKAFRSVLLSDVSLMFCNCPIQTFSEQCC
jgi:hypothetical protein